MQVLVGLARNNEVDTRRAVQLRYDDALGPVNNELAAADHNGHVAEVLFLDRRAVGLAQTEPDAERPPASEAQLAALIRVVARLSEFVADVLGAIFLS